MQPRDAENQQAQKGDWKTGTETWRLGTTEKLLRTSRQDGTCGLASIQLSDNIERGQLYTLRKGDVSRLHVDFGGQGKVLQEGTVAPSPTQDLREACC